MAASVASLLTEALQKSSLIGKMQEKALQMPGVKAGIAAKDKVQQSGAVKVGMKMGGLGMGAMQKTGGLGAAAAAEVPIKAMTGMAGTIKSFLPDIGKLASPTQLLNLPKKLLSKTLGMVGINLTLSTLLRQSQLFTGMFGALFQILGGFVDVILAPFMPFFMSIIRKLASWIPEVRDWAKKAYIWLDTYIFPIIKKAFDSIFGQAAKIKEKIEIWWAENGPEIKQKVRTFWNETAKPAFSKIWEIVQEVYGWGKQHVWPTITAFWDLLVGMWTTLTEFWEKHLPTFIKIFDNVKLIIEGILLWLREDIFPLVQQFWDWLIVEVGGFLVWLTDNVVERLTRIIPMIQDIITNVLDIAINSILIPLWDALEPVLKWFLDLLMDNIEWIVGIIDKKLVPFIKDIIDDLMPHIQELSDLFMKHVAPVIDEAYAAAREFIDAILDVALPIIKWTLKTIIWPLANEILRLAGFIVIVAYKIITFILKILTWILKLPFKWKTTLLDPLLIALDFGFDFLKKMWWWLLNFRGYLIVAIMESLGKFVLRLSTEKIKLFGSTVEFSFLKGIGDKILAAAQTGQKVMKRSHDLMEDSLSHSTGGLRMKYGSQPVEIVINNYTDKGVLDSTKREQVLKQEQIDIENRVERENTLGTYDEMMQSL